MKERFAYVIRDEAGNYVAAQKSKKGWSFLAYTGSTTGFTFYSSKETAELELEALNSMGYDFYLEYIDVNQVPVGERIKQMTAYVIVDENGKYVHRDSIRKAGQEYFYLPYESLKDGCIVYTVKERVLEALKNLELHNRCGGLGHTFKIKEFMV